MKLWEILCAIFAREPDKVIGVNYLERWHLIPKNRLFNVYLHKFSGSDFDRALLDHPWYSVSFLISGELIEATNRYHYLGGGGVLSNRRKIRRWIPVFRSAEFPHRLILPSRSPTAWTVFITGPVIRPWGFLCGDGWRQWREVVRADGQPIEGACD